MVLSGKSLAEKKINNYLIEEHCKKEVDFPK
jgi:hypothetical protein